MRRGPVADDGFALLAALFGVLVFALFAYAVLAADRGASAGVDAQLQQARLRAAADAALATAVEGLGATGTQRWPLGAEPRALEFDGVETEVAVEDERGKVPLNGLSQDQARRLLATAGLAGARLDTLVASLLNWQDGGERPNGAKRVDYAADGLWERGGPIRTFGELAAVHGMSPEILADIAPITSLFAPAGGFDPKTATPEALKVMAPATATGPDAIIRARELAGERAKLDAGPVLSYVGRPITVRVSARDGRGGQFERATVVVLTGQAQHPFWIRAVDG